MTASVPVETDFQRLVVAQALALAREVESTAGAAPHGKVLDRGEGRLTRGRDFRLTAPHGMAPHPADEAVKKGGPELAAAATASATKGPRRARPRRRPPHPSPPMGPLGRRATAVRHRRNAVEGTLRLARPRRTHPAETGGRDRKVGVVAGRVCGSPAFPDPWYRRSVTTTPRVAFAVLDRVVAGSATQAPRWNSRPRLAGGAPIGRGLLDGACQRVLGNRRTQTGARWAAPNANRMAELGCLTSSDPWDGDWLAA